MTAYNFIVQALGVVGIISSIISFQCKEHKPLMRLRTANELLFGLQYLMLGAYTGMLANFIGCVRNIIFTRMVEKKKSTMSMRFLFSVLFIVKYSYRRCKGYVYLCIRKQKHGLRAHYDSFNKLRLAFLRRRC